MTKAPVLIQNASSADQTGWVFIALPKIELTNGVRPPQPGGWLVQGAKRRWPWVACDHGLRVYVSVPANTTIQLKPSDDPYQGSEFVLHPAAAHGIANGSSVPTLWIGATWIAYSVVELVEQSDAHQVWHMRGFSEEYRVTVDMWATVHAQHPTIEFVTHAVYGTVANDGQPQTKTIPELVLTCESELHRDFALRNGQSQATDVAGDHWFMQLVPAGSWHRAVRHETRGAIMTIPDPARKLGQPMRGMSLGWEGGWLALGRVPQKTEDLQPTRAQQKQSYLRPSAGAYTDPRPRCQPREAGTTGEQADFGCVSDLAVVSQEPWEIHDALWQCQSYAQRPTANKEPDGSPMRSELHPLAQTMGQRPDLGYGLHDRLGWPMANQIAWIPSPTSCLWTTQDDQHRSDNFLHATYALTRDHALASIISDHVQLDATDIYTRTGWVPSPRAIGRLALSRANQVWLGFTEAKDALRKGLDAASRNTPYYTLPPDRTVRTLGGYEHAKYGWADSKTGQAITGWQPWQEAIACIGFLAAASVLDDDVYTSVAVGVARTITDNGFRIRSLPTGQSVVDHAYAIRWNDGVPFAASDWPANTDSRDASTDHVYRSTACLTWSLAACELLVMSGEILEHFPHPRSIAESRWRALM